MQKVRCNWCDWTGQEPDLVLEDEEEFCPQCKNSGFIMDIDEKYRVHNPTCSKDNPCTKCIPL